MFCDQMGKYGLIKYNIILLKKNRLQMRGKCLQMRQKVKLRLQLLSCKTVCVMVKMMGKFPIQQARNKFVMPIPRRACSVI